MSAASKTAAGVLAAAVLAIATPFVSDFEGFSQKAYRDPVGIPTICYGYTRGVEVGMVYTKEKCQELLQGELASSIKIVDKYIKVPMPDTRRAALASFVYNAGETNFAYSTLVRKLNHGDVQGGCDQLLKWVYARGVKLPGLVRRRAAERELCLMEKPYVIATTN